MKKSTKQNLGAKVNIFVLICRAAWSSFFQYLQSFTTYNATYTQDYGNEALKALDAAQALPTGLENRGLLKNLRATLKTAAKAVTDYWQTLSNYIEKTFPPDQVEGAKIQAGSPLYEKAVKGNWADVAQLALLAVRFMSDNPDTLLNKGKGMPEGFPELFTTAQDAFTKAQTAYATAKETSRLQTATRNTAFQAVYQTLLSMLKDAKDIFKTDEDLKKSFTYGEIKKRFTVLGPSGLRYTLCYEVTLLPSTTSVLLFQPGNITATPNQDGLAEVKLAAGKYSCTITTPGYPVLELTGITVNTGVMHRKKIIISKVLAAVQPKKQKAALKNETETAAISQSQTTNAIQAIN